MTGAARSDLLPWEDPPAERPAAPPRTPTAPYRLAAGTCVRYRGVLTAAVREGVVTAMQRVGASSETPVADYAGAAPPDDTLEVRVNDVWVRGSRLVWPLAGDPAPGAHPAA